MIIGWLGALAATLLMSYYVMITGNVAHYIVLTLIGSLNNATGSELPAIYQSVASNAPLLIFYNALLLGGAAIVISRGVQGGIEKFAKIALPILFICMIACAIKSLTLPAAKEAIIWFLTPDFTKVTPTLLLDCLSQTLFLGGLGMASVFVFGSYPPDNSSLTKSSVVMIMSNIVVAILAGFIIFPAVFSFGVDPTSGSSLVFQTMPVLFANMTGGWFFGSLFFLTLLVAAYTTCLGLIEGIAATLADAFNIQRKTMVWLTTGAIFMIGLIPIFVHTPLLSEVRLLGKDLYTMLDFVTMYIIIPAGCLMTVIYFCWKFGFDRAIEETNKGATLFKINNGWKPVIGVICPIIIVTVLAMGIKGTFY